MGDSNLNAKWIFCGGMLRSGSTLQYNIAAEIVERSGFGRRERWIDDHAEYFSTMQSEEAIVFKSHVLSPQISEIFAAQQGLSLVSYRDIRDATASWQAKNRTVLTVEEAINFSDAAINQLKKWEELPVSWVFYSRYEDFHGSIKMEIEAIAHWLGILLEQDVVENIESLVSVESLSKLNYSGDESEFTRSGHFVWNSKTLVHIDHLNGGDVGRYQRELSAEVAGCLNDRHGEWLVDHGYSLS